MRLPRHRTALPRTAPRAHEVRQLHMGGLRIEHVTEVPPWAGFLSLVQWRSLLVAVERELVGRGLVARFQGDHFSAAFPDGRLGELGLVNLAGRCRDASVEAHARLVREHFEALLGAIPAVAPTLDGGVDYAEVAPRLIVHLYREEMLGKARDAVVARPLCAGLVSALAVDFGHCIASLPRDATARWTQSEDELFRRGLANVQRRRVRRETFPSHRLPGVFLSGDDRTVTSQVHFLGNHLGRHYPAGAIVGLPARCAIFAMPLQTGAGRRAFERLAEAIDTAHALFEGLAKEHPDEVFSPHLYWWHDGALTTLSSGDRVLMAPQGMLESLISAPTGADA